MLDAVSASRGLSMVEEGRVVGNYPEKKLRKEGSRKMNNTKNERNRNLTKSSAMKLTEHCVSFADDVD